MALIRVYRKDTGEAVEVPEHFMSHIVLRKPFRKTPTPEAREAEEQAEAQARAALAPLTQTSDSSAAEPATTPSTQN